MAETQSREAPRAEHLRHIIHEIGLGELRPDEIVSRRIILRRQTQIGLERKGPPTREDGGILAIRTGIPHMTPEAWGQVPPGSKAFAADIAGTNWNVMSATKKADGNVILTQTSIDKYEGEERKLTYSDFISRMVYPIAGEVINNASKRGIDIEKMEPIDVGISFGFPHENIKTPSGMDALLVDVKPDGTMPKGWQITDWNPDKQSNITHALRERLKGFGIKVKTLVAINDTPAVALDGGAVETATSEGLEVIPAGFVGGTGTNGAVDIKGLGLINLEIGHAEFPEDEIFKRMKNNGWIKVDKPEIEFETGQALAWRLAAGMQLLHERDETFQLDEQLFEELKPKDPNKPDAPAKDPALLDHIATGKRATNPEIQNLAQLVLKRAGQIYGITLATIAETADGATRIEGQNTRAFMVEGGTLLRGHGVKETAEHTAAILGQPIKIFQARGLRGVGSLAMAYPHLKK